MVYHLLRPLGLHSFSTVSQTVDYSSGVGSLPLRGGLALIYDFPDGLLLGSSMERVNGTPFTTYAVPMTQSLVTSGLPLWLSSDNHHYDSVPLNFL